MKLLVYMKDARTVFALRGRAELARLISEKRGPAHEEEPLVVVRGIWNPLTGLYVWQPGIRLRFLARGSVAAVEEGDPNRAGGQVLGSEPGATLEAVK